MSIHRMLEHERAGAWNLKVGRHPDVVAHEVLRLLRENQLDWLVIIEAHQYIRALRRVLAGTGWLLVTDNTDGSAKDSAVIVKGALLDNAGHLFRLGGIEWERKPGRPGLHWARSGYAVTVFGLKVLAIHLPPGPFGPRFPLRRLAYAVACRKVRRIGRRWTALGHPFVMPGDWNKLKTVVGTWLNPSPRWIAEGTDARIVGKGIDYVLAAGVAVKNYRKLVGFGRSDHWPIVFDVVRPTHQEEAA